MLLLIIFVRKVVHAAGMKRNTKKQKKEWPQYYNLKNSKTEAAMIGVNTEHSNSNNMARIYGGFELKNNDECYFCEGKKRHFGQICGACDSTGSEKVRKQIQKVYNAKNNLPINYEISEKKNKS